MKIFITTKVAVNIENKETIFLYQLREENVSPCDKELRIKLYADLIKSKIECNSRKECANHFCTRRACTRVISAMLHGIPMSVAFYQIATSTIMNSQGTFYDAIDISCKHQMTIGNKAKQIMILQSMWNYVLQVFGIENKALEVNKINLESPKVMEGITPVGLITVKDMFLGEDVSLEINAEVEFVDPISLKSIIGKLKEITKDSATIIMSDGKEISNIPLEGITLVY